MFRDALMLALGFGGFGLVASTSRARRWRAPPAARPLTDDLRDRFLATISHELRTPLNAIIGWVQMLKMGSLKPAEVSHAIDAIDRNARIEARMVSDLLDVSRMRRGFQIVSRTIVDLVRVAHVTVAALRSEADTKRIVLNAEGSSKGVDVAGDRVRLEQMMRHLVTNSIKFTPAGGRIDVRVYQRGPLGVIHVADTGVGVAPEHLPHLLEPFYQVPSRSRSMRSGLGLGLTLAAEIVEMHYGTIDVTSPGRGNGTLVVVQLPTVRVHRRS
jgi:signal transduction histidine kinase